MGCIVVTAGSKYSDIDVLASAIAYAEVIDGVAVLPGEFNATIPKSIRKWDLKYIKECPNEVDQYVMVDISDPDRFSEFVEENKISEVWDHRPGFEVYWQEKGRIEKVGACATQIFEMFVYEPEVVTANLLYTAIFANTLNFKASVTTQRDIEAFEKLKQYINLPDNWIEKYYNEVEETMLLDLEHAVENDTKIIKGYAVAQLELWDAKQLLQDENFEADIRKVLDKHDKWFLNMPSISEGRNYIFTNVEDLKGIVIDNLGGKYEDEYLITNKLYLRKEILPFVKKLVEEGQNGEAG